MSLAEETEAGSTEYRDRLLDLVESAAGDTARAFAAAYVRRLSTDGHLGRAPRRRGARRVRVRRRARPRSRSPCARSTRRSTTTATSRSARVLETNTDDWPFLVDSRERRARGARRARRAARAPDHRDLARGRADHARLARAQRGPPRVGHALRPRAQADRRASSRSSSADIEAVAARRPQHGHRLRRDDPARGVDDLARAPRRARATTPTRSARRSTSWPGCCAATSSCWARASTRSRTTRTAASRAPGLGILADEERSAYSHAGAARRAPRGAAQRSRPAASC